MVFNNKHEQYLFNSILNDDNFKKTKENNEFLYFNQYKNYLLNRFQDYTFEDIKGSEIINNEYGEVLKITDKQNIDFNLKNINFREHIKDNLKLVEGIGIKREIDLKNKGYNSINDLLSHSKYSKLALDTLEYIDNLTTQELINFIKKNKYTKKCNQDLIKTANLFDESDFKFMDIETLGLSNVPIILIGVSEVKNNKIITIQYLMRDIIEEAAGLEEYKTHLDENSAHVTFNGKFFDVPYIKNRLKYYGIASGKLNIPHFDLLYYARQLWGEELPNCKLQTIEKYKFNLERKGDVPGQYIPDYYHTYLNEDNIGPLIPIIEHNKQDIISLASFLKTMYMEVDGD